MHLKGNEPLESRLLNFLYKIALQMFAEQHAKHWRIGRVLVTFLGKLDTRIAWVSREEQLVILSASSDNENKFVLIGLVNLRDSSAFERGG